MVRHVLESCPERLPILKAVLSRDQLLRIAQLESLRENFGIGHAAEAGQAGPDLGGDRIIAVAMPA